MSPCTPFLTEHLNQNLRRLKPAHPHDGSIHFQMMPDVDENLIKLDIERAIEKMTNVIKLGRAIRDRKVHCSKKCHFFFKILDFCFKMVVFFSLPQLPRETKLQQNYYRYGNKNFFCIW